MTPACRCVTNDQLRRRIAELEEEVAAWKARDRGWADESAALTRIAAARLKLGCKGPPARLLLFLIDHAGRVVSSERLFHVVSDPESDANPNIVKVYVAHLRQSLRWRDAPGGVATHWGEGYSISAIDAAALTAWLAEPETAPQPLPRKPTAVPKRQAAAAPELSKRELRVLLSRMTDLAAAVTLVRHVSWVREMRDRLDDAEVAA